VCDDVYSCDDSEADRKRIINISLIIYPTFLINHVFSLNETRSLLAEYRYGAISRICKETPKHGRLVSQNRKPVSLSPLALALPPFCPSKPQLFEFNLGDGQSQKHKKVNLFVGATFESMFETQEVYESMNALLETAVWFQEMTWIWNAAQDLDVWIEQTPPKIVVQPPPPSSKDEKPSFPLLGSRLSANSPPFIPALISPWATSLPLVPKTIPKYQDPLLAKCNEWIRSIPSDVELSLLYVSIYLYLFFV
jgi:hypothetical protein